MSVSLTLDPKKLPNGLESKVAEMQRITDEFAKFAEVSVSYDWSILSLIGNVERNNEILERRDPPP